MNRPAVVPHFGSVRNTKTFAEAFASIQANPKKSYFTDSGKEFTAEGRIVTKGAKAGEKVIVFNRLGKESARAYTCCWDSRTNCNRTYIDSYSHKV